MLPSRVSLVAVVVLALSCGGSSRPATLSSTWVAPAILAQVPADSPYVIATLQPIDEQLRRLLFGSINQSVKQLLQSADRLQGQDRASLEPLVRAGLAVADELRGKDPNQWWRELGFDANGRFVLYGLSVWPVARIELADPERVRGMIERVVTAAGLQPRRATLDGHAYWSTGTAEITVVAAVLAHEAVIAVLPTSGLTGALPLVLGTQKPAHPLGATTKVTDLLARNHLMNLMLGYIDLRAAVAAITGPTPTPLDASLRALAGPIPPACLGDLDRVVSILPRVVFGYRRFDETGFEARMIFETLPSVITALKRLRASVPELTVPMAGHPLFAMGAAFKPDELMAWLRGVVGELRDHPLTCPAFDGFNRAVGGLATKLAQPLPPVIRDLRGFSLVVDQLTITPFDVEGHLLIATDHASDLLAMAAGTIPWLPNLPVKPDGRPVELPTQQLHVPVRSAHVAMTPDRIVIAAGPGSAQRAAAHLASPVPRSSPLGVMMFDAPRVQALVGSMGANDSNNFSYLGNCGMSFDVNDDGLGVAAWGTWQDPPAAAAIAK